MKGNNYFYFAVTLRVMVSFADCLFAYRLMSSPAARFIADFKKLRRFTQ